MTPVSCPPTILWLLLARPQVQSAGVGVGVEGSVVVGVEGSVVVDVKGSVGVSVADPVCASVVVSLDPGENRTVLKTKMLK